MVKKRLGLFQCFSSFQQLLNHVTIKNGRVEAKILLNKTSALTGSEKLHLTWSDETINGFILPGTKAIVARPKTTQDFRANIRIQPPGTHKFYSHI